MKLRSYIFRWRLLSHMRRFWIFRALLFKSVLTLLVACLFEGTVKEKEQLSKTQWKIDKITYDLGKIVAGDTVYRLGKKMIVGGDEMLSLVDTVTDPTEPVELFSGQRECFYSLKWESPGECVEDDSWSFSEDGSFTIKDGEMTCPGRSEMPPGNWSANREETEVSVTVLGETRGFAVEEFNASSLRLSETRTDTTACGSTVLIKTIYSFSAF